MHPRHLAHCVVVTLALAACSERQAGDSAQMSASAEEAGAETSRDAHGADGSDAPAREGAEPDDRTEAMDWYFSRTAAGPKLAYGEPQTDNVRLNLRCGGDDIVLHFMRLAEVVRSRPERLTVASGGNQLSTGLTTEPSQLGGLSISARVPASSAPMTAFGSGNALDVGWGEETIHVPGTEKAETFLAACG